MPRATEGDHSMTSTPRPSASHYALVACGLGAVMCGIGWFKTAGKLHDADARIRALESENDDLKAKYDANQLALVQVHAWPDPAGFKSYQEDLDGESESTGARAVLLTIAAAEDGQVASLKVGVAELFDGPLDPGRMRQLDRRLTDIFAVEGQPFDWIILRVGNGLRFSELLKVLVVCSRQKLLDGDHINKVAFLSLPDD